MVSKYFLNSFFSYDHDLESLNDYIDFKYIKVIVQTKFYNGWE